MLKTWKTMNFRLWNVEKMSRPFPNLKRIINIFSKLKMFCYSIL